MKEKREIQDYLLDKFAFLKNEYGLSELIIEDNGWITDIYYLGYEIGIEFELDLHDFDVFVLVVLLEDGKIPGGYYMNKGAKCRVHLEKILLEQLHISRKYINSLGDENVRNKHHLIEVIKSRLDSYSTMLKDHIAELLSIGNTIFK